MPKRRAGRGQNLAATHANRDRESLPTRPGSLGLRWGSPSVQRVALPASNGERFDRDYVLFRRVVLPPWWQWETDRVAAGRDTVFEYA